MTWDLDAARKDGYDDFMSKEMHEQPKAVADTLLDRLLPDGTLSLDEVHITNEELRRSNKVFIVACGSSYHAGLMAKYAIEHWARIPVEIDIASEFIYRDPVLDATTLVIGVSQSGETADTRLAMEEAQSPGGQGPGHLQRGRLVDGPGERRRPLHPGRSRDRRGRHQDAPGPNHRPRDPRPLPGPGPGHAVAGRRPHPVRGHGRCCPTRWRRPSSAGADVEAVAARYRDSPSFMFLGRQVGYPVALEGALKLKELSYLRAEGFPAGELKHGPIALVEPGTVVIAVATRTPIWEKMMSNVTEVKSRGATVVLVANDGDEETARQADAVLWVPETEYLFAPIIDVVPMQLFAYHLARLHGLDVDRPRNLAKVVTVE